MKNQTADQTIEAIAELERLVFAAEEAYERVIAEHEALQEWEDEEA